MSRQQPMGWSARASVRTACMTVCAAVVFGGFSGSGNPAVAGPFTDWLKGFHQPSTPSGNCANGKCAPGAVPGAVPGATPGTIVYPPGVSPPPPPGGTVIPGTTLPGATLQPGAMPPSTIPGGGGYPASGYPTRTNYPPAYGVPSTVIAPQPFAPTTTYYNMQPGALPTTQPVTQPPTGYYTPAPSKPACPSCQRPVTVNYAPYTTYRTTWIQVPVTVYRPVSGIDPATGRPVTIVQPCQTTQWQVQRVPVSGPFTSMYRALPVSGYQTVAPAYYQGAPCVVAPAAAVAPGMTYSAPAAVPGAASYPAAPATSYPAGTYPGGSYPAAPSVPSNVVPATPIPNGGGTTIPGGGLQPADRAPSLNPGGLNYPPATDPYSSGSTPSPSNDSTIPRSPPPPPPPTESTGANGANAWGGGNAGTGTNRSTSGESRPLKVRPIPDPDYSRAAPQGPSSAPSSPTRSSSPPAAPAPAATSPSTPAPTIPANPSIDSPLRNVPPLLSPRDRTADRGESRWRSLGAAEQ